MPERQEFLLDAHQGHVGQRAEAAAHGQQAAHAVGRRRGVLLLWCAALALQPGQEFALEVGDLPR